MTNYIHKICPVCRINFLITTKKEKQTYCSATCYKVVQRANSQPKQDTCSNCQKLIGQHGRKFCSKSCSASYNNTRRNFEIRQKQSTSLRQTLTAKRPADTFRNAKKLYQDQCRFNFNPYLYPQLPGYELLQKHGIYCPKTNKQGVVRDHIISKEWGWNNNISPLVIAHPANCQFLSHQDNAKKKTACHMSIEELEIRIENWNTMLDSEKSYNQEVYPLQTRSGEIYRWILENTSTHEMISLTNITKWMSENKIHSGMVYGSRPQWIIKEKYNIRTGNRLL